MATAEEDPRIKILRGQQQQKGMVQNVGMGVAQGGTWFMLVLQQPVYFRQLLETCPDEALPHMLKDLTDEMRRRGVSSTPKPIKTVGG